MAGIAAITAAVLGGTTARLERRWSRAVLADADVLIVPPCGGGREITEDEVRLVLDFVSEGGGLLVLGPSGEHHAWASRLLSPLSLGFDIGGPYIQDETDAHLLRRDLWGTPAGRHPTVDGVQSISYHQGRYVSFRGDATVLYRAPRGEVVAAAVAHGRGRVVAFGSALSFTDPYVGHRDNALCFTNLLSWLAGRQTGLEAGAVTTLDTMMRTGMEQQGVGEPTGPAHADVPWVISMPPGAEGERAAALRANPYEDLDEFLMDAELHFHRLPIDIRRRVLGFRNRSNGMGALLIRGLPQDPDLPATPRDSKRSPEKVTFLSEFWLAVFGTALGHPISYVQEKDGEIFQNVCPTETNAKNLSSESSDILLDFHTETAFHPFSPDHLLLYCLRSDHENRAETIISDARSMADLVPLKYRAVLFEKLFRTGIDFSFGSPNGTRANGPLGSVLRGDRFAPDIRFDPDLMVGLGADAQAALETMASAAHRSKSAVRLRPGDLMIIDNRKAIHGRTSFVPRYDGHDRWLQRLYTLRSLDGAVERGRHAHMVATRFAV
ncbi:DUF4350 domain-containing protein [Streptomyces sp. NPDC013978]|uniref:DUF4350 domain-containing protein n=1 Tax=Streptomyces sp. NPDC013978 TaxID=3364869 RepID=UPI0036FF4A31